MLSVSQTGPTGTTAESYTYNETGQTITRGVWKAEGERRWDGAA
ncbi:hypothetical protein [Streptomyces finlayi]|nr:hypothetical protein [Streptomyces finlayi]